MAVVGIIGKVRRCFLLFTLLCSNCAILPTAAQATTEIDIPLSIGKKAEQILYRHGYVVSYNKDTRTRLHLLGLHGISIAHRIGYVEKERSL